MDITTGTSNPKGPSTQYFRTLVPETINSMVLGTRNLKYRIFGPSASKAVDISGHHGFHNSKKTSFDYSTQEGGSQRPCNLT